MGVPVGVPVASEEGVWVFVIVPDLLTVPVPVPEEVCVGLSDPVLDGVPNPLGVPLPVCVVLAVVLTDAVWLNVFVGVQEAVLVCVPVV